MSEPQLSFKELMQKYKENAKEVMIRLDTLEKTSDRQIKWIYSSFLGVYSELSLIFEALKELYEKEIEKYKPMLEYLNRWVQERKSEDEEKERYK
jgi:ABC-type Zn uptake system ZnuABC Zn-binding protein ZnuA